MCDPSARAGNERLLRRMPEDLDSIRGIAALISGLDVLPRSVTCCNYTMRVLNGFGFLVYVIDLITLRAIRSVAWRVTVLPTNFRGIRVKRSVIPELYDSRRCMIQGNDRPNHFAL